jgi:predicted peptidase
LLKPPRIEPGKKYPAVLFLHGAGECGNDNRKQLTYLPEWMARPQWREKYACYLIAPQCPCDKWWSIRRPEEGATADAAHKPGEADIALSILDALASELPIDPAREYLTGLSMGGYGTWALAAEHPQRFAAVVPLCGAGNRSWASRLRDVPLWAVHGDADKSVSVQKSRDMIEAIRAAGGNPHYSELKDVPHDCWTPAYNDPDGPLSWMFAQHK